MRVAHTHQQGKSGRGTITPTDGKCFSLLSQACVAATFFFDSTACVATASSSKNLSLGMLIHQGPLCDTYKLVTSDVLKYIAQRRVSRGSTHYIQDTILKRYCRRVQLK